MRSRGRTEARPEAGASIEKGVLMLPEDDTRYYRENIILLEDRAAESFPDAC